MELIFALLFWAVLIFSEYKEYKSYGAVGTERIEKYGQFREYASAPVRSFPARIISKSRIPAEAKPEKSFRYYITFRAADGSQKELAVDESTYMLRNIGTAGSLLFLRDLFFCFVPTGKPLPVTFPQDTQVIPVKIKKKRREEIPFICSMSFETPDIPRLEMDVDPMTYELFFEGDVVTVFSQNGEFRGLVPQIRPLEDIDPALFVRRYPEQNGQGIPAQPASGFSQQDHGSQTGPL